MLGAAVRLCTLAWLGYVPDDVAAGPGRRGGAAVAEAGIPVGELRGYGAREQTRTGHLREVVAYLGWRTVDEPRWEELEEFLFARAMEQDSPKLLAGCDFETPGQGQLHIRRSSRRHFRNKSASIEVRYSLM